MCSRQRLLFWCRAVLVCVDPMTGRHLEACLTGYADLNGLHMSYEVHGEGSARFLD